jgi:hypothetical protein
MEGAREEHKVGLGPFRMYYRSEVFPSFPYKVCQADHKFEYVTVDAARGYFATTVHNIKEYKSCVLWDIIGMVTMLKMGSC